MLESSRSPKVAGAQLSRFQARRGRCKWSGAGIHSGGRRAVLRRAQKQKDPAVRPLCALRSGFPRPRPDPLAPRCSRSRPASGFCPAWSPPGLKRFALWPLPPLHPRPALLPASASESPVFCLNASLGLWAPRGVSGFPVLFLDLLPVFPRASLTTAVPSLSLDIS